MKWLKFLLLSIVFFMCSSIQNKIGLTDVVFAAKVGLLPNSEVTNIFILNYRDGHLSGSQKINFKDFVKFAQGKWPCTANKEKKNLFEENDIDLVQMENQMNLKVYDYCKTVEELWKIRFDTYPYDPGTEEGWSNGDFRPSKSQQVYMFENFGVSRFESEYFVDTSFWKLLRSCQDTSWVADYKNLVD